MAAAVRTAKRVEEQEADDEPAWRVEDLLLRVAFPGPTWDRCPQCASN